VCRSDEGRYTGCDCIDVGVGPNNSGRATASWMYEFNPYDTERLCVRGRTAPTEAGLVFGPGDARPVGVIGSSE